MRQLRIIAGVLFLVAGFMQLALAGPSIGGEARLAGVSGPSTLPRLTEKFAPKAGDDMSPWLQPVQARCPAGQLVFLTSACGCNGACCRCSAETPYLDHCTCRCSATPPSECRTGFSAARK